MQQSSQIPLQLFIYVLPVSMYKGFVSQLRRFSFFSPFFFLFFFFLSFFFSQTCFPLRPAFARLILRASTNRYPEAVLTDSRGNPNKEVHLPEIMI